MGADTRDRARGPPIGHFLVDGYGVSHSDVTLWEIQVPDSLLHGVRPGILPVI